MLLAVVVVVVLAAGAWRVIGDEGGASGPDRIYPRAAGAPTDTVIFGDSVSDQTRAAYSEAIGDAGGVRVVAFPGVTSNQLVGMARDEMDRRGDGPRDRAVFLVGYNDVLTNADDDSIDELLEVADSFRCTLWLTLPEDAGGRQGPDALLDQAGARAWNELARERAAGHGGVQVVTGWQEAVEGDAEGRLLRDDGVHPTPEGEAVLARVVADALQATCG